MRVVWGMLWVMEQLITFGGGPSEIGGSTPPAFAAMNRVKTIEGI